MPGGGADFSFDGALAGALVPGVLGGGVNAVAVPADAGAGGSEGFGVDGFDVSGVGADGLSGASLLPPGGVSSDSAVAGVGFAFASPGFGGVVTDFASLETVPGVDLPLAFFESPDDISHSPAPLTSGGVGVSWD